MNEIKEGLKELHSILKNDCRFASKDFANEFLNCIKMQSGSETLSDICRNIIDKK